MILVLFRPAIRQVFFHELKNFRKIQIHVLIGSLVLIFFFAGNLTKTYKLIACHTHTHKSVIPVMSYAQ